jgi:hypothetical protein
VVRRHDRGERQCRLRSAAWGTSAAVGENYDNQNDQQEAEAAAGVVAPVRAVGPGRKRSEQEQDEQDQQDCSHLESPLQLFQRLQCGMVWGSARRVDTRNLVSFAAEEFRSWLRKDRMEFWSGRRGSNPCPKLGKLLFCH